MQNEEQASALMRFHNLKRLDLTNSIGPDLHALKAGLTGLHHLQSLTCLGNLSTGNRHLATITMTAKQLQVTCLLSIAKQHMSWHD